MSPDFKTLILSYYTIYIFYLETLANIKENG